MNKPHLYYGLSLLLMVGSYGCKSLSGASSTSRTADDAAFKKMQHIDWVNDMLSGKNQVPAFGTWTPSEWDRIDNSWMEVCKVKLSLSSGQLTSCEAIWSGFMQRKTEHVQAVAYRGAAQLDIDIQQERKAALDQMNTYLTSEQQRILAQMRDQLGN